MKARKMFFFEKQSGPPAAGQTTFARFPPADVSNSRVKVTNVFCGAFFQKSDLFLRIEVL